MADEVKQDQQYLKPTYQGQYDQKVNDIYSQLEQRKPFSFDGNDALYEQYVDRYMQGGKKAMKDTVGQGAALTGGYTNSYAQNVGQQAYDSYLQGLNDKLGDIYQMQMQAYQLEGDRLNGLLGNAATLADSDYNRLFNEAQMRQGMGDDSLMRQLLGMPKKSSGGRYYGGGSGSGGGDIPTVTDSDIVDYGIRNGLTLREVTDIAKAENPGGNLAGGSGTLYDYYSNR